MSLNNFFDKIYCINLKKRVDRWQLVSDEFHKIDCIVERFEGIEGIKFKNRDLKINPGECGAYLSHMGILEYIIENNIEKTLIFEDDVVFCENFNEKFERSYNNLPDNWGLVYISANSNNLIQIKDNIYKTTDALTTHSYFVNLETAKKLYDLLLRFNFSKPLDNVYVELQSKEDVYVFRPNLTYQREGYSDIRGGFRNYDKVLKQ